MAGGRPTEWTEELIAKAKELYLQLVTLGKSEREIDAVEEIPGWSQRYAWRKDPEFSTQLKEARLASGDVHAFEALGIVEHAYERALDEAASPQLVTAANNYAKMKMMVAAKLNKETWGDKVTIGGDAENPIKTDMNLTVTFVKPDAE